jgi:hypothetical protein
MFLVFFSCVPSKTRVVPGRAGPYKGMLLDDNPKAGARPISRSATEIPAIEGGCNFVNIEASASLKLLACHALPGTSRTEGISGQEELVRGRLEREFPTAHSYPRSP